MELKGKRQRHGAAAAPTTRTPGSFPPSRRDPFRWIRLTFPPGIAGRLRVVRLGQTIPPTDQNE